MAVVVPVIVVNVMILMDDMIGMAAIAAAIASIAEAGPENRPRVTAAVTAAVARAAVIGAGSGISLVIGFAGRRIARGEKGRRGER